MDCPQPTRDLSYLRNDDIPDFNRRVRRKPCVDLARMVKTSGMDEQDTRELIERTGGPLQFGLKADQGEEFLRMLYGDFHVDPYHAEWPEEFFHVNGALSDFVWYATVTAHRKQPMICLLSAITMVGSLIGRKLKSSLGARGVTYIVTIAPSSAGKNRPREVIQELFSASGAAAYLLGEDVTSDSAISDALASFPVKLILWDEFGKALEIANHPQSAGPLKQATALVMKLATSAGVKDFMPKKFADPKFDRMLHKAHLSILGTMTDAGVKHLTPDTMKDGFNSRFLFYPETGGRPDHRNPPETAIPDSLVEWSREWAEYRPDDGDISWENGPEQRVIEVSPQARTSWDRFRLRCDVLGDAYTEDEGASIWGRAAEKASNFALIAAASEFVPAQEFQIEQRHMDWAIAIVDWLVIRSVKMLESVSKTERSRHMDEIEEFVKSKRHTGAPLSLVTKAFHHRLKTQYRNELIADLCESGRLICIETGGHVGRKTRTLYWPEFAPALAAST
ncbi:DUF3987 domain-containing protein [Planctomicrobium piriforme]|uniref:DUF3987 domain-containing protein n=1 Tax=Planctomicrobium piriforme TaxID=1576369 RepID=A0A1I3L1G9_9PLAN|nr:DUF3987 domain-containing protein [Planctomicrobium piriforme]SFI78603.1 Protein of unknown function [Planctomicrobium piriforme]